MTRTDWACIALVVACGAIGWWGGHQRMGRLRAEGAAVVWQDRADSAVAAAETALSGLETLQLQEDPIREQYRLERDSARAAAAAEHQRNLDARARAQRAAASAPDAIAKVRASAGDSAATVAALDELLEVQADQVAALETRATAAEAWGDLLERGLAAADSISASLTRERDAALAAIEPLQVALGARTAEAERWRRAARPSGILGFHVEPLPAFVVGVGVGAIVVIAGRTQGSTKHTTHLSADVW